MTDEYQPMPMLQDREEYAVKAIPDVNM